MPFAWTAINVLDIIAGEEGQGGREGEGEGEREREREGGGGGGWEESTAVMR